MTSGFPLIEVTIEIDNNNRYAQVSAVLDDDKIYEVILELRRKWKIAKLYSSYDEWIKHRGGKREKSFSEEVNNLRNLLKLSPQYNEVLKKAVVCNKVSDIDFQSTYSELSYSPSNLNESNIKYKIVITPESTLPEVERLFKEFKKALQYSRKVKSGDRVTYDYLPNLPRGVIVDTKSEVKRNRGWFWDNKKGKRPVDIAKDAKERGAIEVYRYRDTVRKGIKAYKELLQNFRNS